VNGGQWLLFASLMLLVGTLSWLAVVLHRAVKVRDAKLRHPAGKDLDNG
jgi:uncharacterized membrane protein